MSTTTSTDWIGQAIAAYRAQQTAEAIETRAQQARCAAKLGDILATYGIDAQPDTYPYTLDGVAFRLDTPWDQHPRLEVRRVCALCGDVPGAEDWVPVTGLADLGYVLSTPWHCYNYTAHRTLQGQPADDPATALVEALRAFVNWERDNG